VAASFISNQAACAPIVPRSVTLIAPREAALANGAASRPPTPLYCCVGTEQTQCNINRNLYVARAVVVQRELVPTRSGQL